MLAAWRAGWFTLVTSPPLLDELADVLTRPRVARRHGLPAAAVALLVEGFRTQSQVVDLTGSIQVCRDPDDDALIETAMVGGAVCVVSGDQDLHASEVTEYLEARGIRVLTVRQFLEELEVEDRKPG